MAQQTSISYYQTEFKFNGKELDSETGMYYYGARYFDPSLSIWMSVDPLAEKFPNFSPYNYTMNNPINLVDPDGRAAEGVQNPVYGSDGVYRGDTLEGFTGIPVIYDGNADFENMNSKELTENGSRYLNQVRFNNFYVRDRIITHIANAQLNDGLDLGEEIIITSFKSSALWNANLADSGDMNIRRGVGDSMIDEMFPNSDNYYEPSVENLRNVILSHEVNHTDCGLNLGGDHRSHRAIVMAQMSHPQFQKTTARFQQYVAFSYVVNHKGSWQDLPSPQLMNQAIKLYNRYYQKPSLSDAQIFSGK